MTIIFILKVLSLAMSMGLVLGTHPDCLQSPCGNGICFYNTSAGAAACVCSAGYKGQYCTDPDPCASSPCQNAGTCGSTNTGYICTCRDGFTGSDCETTISSCSSNPCVNGLCVDQGFSFKCQCAPGYTGKLCDHYIGLCGDDPCNQQDAWATCTEEDIGYTCDCSSDEYYGLRCEDHLGTCGQQEESYCICSVDNKLIKVPLPNHAPSQGVNSRDVVAAIIGLLLAWVLGFALLLLAHYWCCSQWLNRGGAVASRTGRLKRPWERPNTVSSTDTMTTSGSRSGLVTPRQVHPKVTPSLDKNVYRAGFVDDMSHMVSSRKSPSTYTSGSKDW